jgi:hypothetical protein
MDPPVKRNEGRLRELFNKDREEFGPSPSTVRAL